MSVLSVEDLAVSCNDRIVVEYARLSLNSGDVAVLLGPNASGKSSLLNAIAGHPRYKVVRGRIRLFGVDVTNSSAKERIELGLGIAVQNPPKLKGVKLGMLLESIVKKRGGGEEEVKRIAKMLAIEHLLDREFGMGFSGGELKRAEIALLIAQQPRIALVDEPDSGVDVDSVMVIASALEELLSESAEAMLIVTHSGMIVKHVRCSKVYVMLNKRIVLESPEFRVVDEVLSKGFKWIEGGEGA